MRKTHIRTNGKTKIIVKADNLPKKQIRYEDFKACIETFVSDNYRVASRDENAEIRVDDWKGSFDKALKDLYKAVCL